MPSVCPSGTVFAIAHRLGTIIDYDRIAVLENAQLVEFGPPAELLREGHAGPFSKLIDRTGSAVSEHLRSIAQGKAAFDLGVLQLEEMAAE